MAALINAQYYDPTSRDYSEICNEMAEFAGDNFCRVFDICCRDRANNRLNGDRCQLADPTNGCQLTPEGSVDFVRCRAYNCTAEVTTTTTTTTTTRMYRVPSTDSGVTAGGGGGLVTVVTALLIAYRHQQHHY